jgi:hypothetical protein
MKLNWLGAVMAALTFATGLLAAVNPANADVVLYLDNVVFADGGFRTIRKSQRLHSTLLALPTKSPA